MCGSRSRGRQLEVIRVGVVKFLGEQDGDVERELKSALTPLLAKHRVKRAYLCQAQEEKPSEKGIALCLAGRRKMGLVREAAEVFRVRFRAEEHLDILFLDGKHQEAELSSVRRPFYVA